MFQASRASRTCSDFANRGEKNANGGLSLSRERSEYAGWMRRPEEVARMNPSEVEPSLENGFLCGSCDRPKDDVYILRDGSVVCADCVELWKLDRVKQN